MKWILFAVLIAMVMVAAPGPVAAQSTGTNDQELQGMSAPGSSTKAWRIHSDGTRVNLHLPVGALRFTGVTQANLVNVDLGPGTIVYCTDCTKATPCAGSGTGAWAKRRPNGWDCD